MNEYAQSVEEDFLGKPTERSHTLEEEGNIALSSMVFDPAANTEGNIAANTVQDSEDSLRAFDKQRNAHIALSASQNVIEDTDELEVDAAPEDILAGVVNDRPTGEILNDVTLDIGGSTITSENVATLEGLNTVVNRLTAKYFTSDPSQAALSIASTVFLGAVEQGSFMNTVHTITGTVPVGTTHAKKVLADWMYGADADRRVEALSVVADLFENGDLHSSYFVQMNLLTALNGSDQSEGLAWDTLNTTLDILDAIPVLALAGKAIGTTLRSGVKAGVVGTATDGYKYMTTMQQDVLSRALSRKFPSKKQQEILKATKELEDEIEDSLLRGTTNSGSVHIVSESNPELGNKLKSKIVTDDSDLIEPAVLARGGTDKLAVQMEMFPLDPATLRSPTIAKNSAQLRKVVDDDLADLTTPNVPRNSNTAQTFTNAEKASSLERITETHINMGAASKYNEKSKPTLEVNTVRVISHNTGQVVSGVKAVRDVDYLKDTSTGFTTETIYGDPKAGGGFANVQEIKNIIGNLRQYSKIPSEDLQIMYREPGTGKVRPLTKDEWSGLTTDKDSWGAGGNYYLKRTEEHSYNKNDLLGDAVEVKRGYHNIISRALYSGVAKITEEYNHLVQATLDRSEAVKQQYANMLPDLGGLSFKQRTSINVLLENGNKYKKEYTDSQIVYELANSGLSTPKLAEVMTAYRQYRVVAHAMWEEKNAATFKQLVEGDVKHLLTADGKHVDLVTVVNKEDFESTGAMLATLIDTKGPNSGGGVMWDVDNLSEYRVDSHETLANLLNNPDIKIVKSLDKEMGHRPDSTPPTADINPRNTEAADSRYRYMIVNTKEDYHRLAPPPSQPISKRIGWVPQQTLENVFVRVPRRTLVNGVMRTFTDTRAAFRNHKEATEYVEELRKDLQSKIDNGEDTTAIVVDKDGNIEITVDTDKHSPSFSTGSVEEQYRDGKLAVTPRKVKPLEHGDREVRLQSPIEAMEQATATIGKLGGGMESLLSASRARFLARYGNELKDTEDYASGFKDPTSDLARQGEEFRRYVDALHRTTEVPDEFVQAVLWSAVSKLDTLGKGNPVITKLAEFGYDIARATSPIVTTKGLVFTTLIGLAPARHVLMQASQYSFIAALDGKAAAIAAPQGLALFSASISTKGSKAYDAAVYAATKTGISKNEFEELVVEFKKSGVMAGMDSNMFQVENLHAANRNPARTRVGQAARDTMNVIKTVPRGMTAIGFNTGEALNLSMTYMFQAQRMRADGLSLRKDVLGSKDNLEVLATSAKTLALSPNKNGAYIWQRGLLGIGTQFLGFQMKALEFLMVNKGSVKLDGKARAKLASAQLLLWGGAGWGLDAAVDHGAEKWAELFGEPMPKEVKNLLKGGATDLAFNSIAEAITGEESTVNFGSSLAALPQIPSAVIEMWNHGVDSPDAWKLALGPTAATFSNTGIMFQDLASAMTTPNLGVNERAMLTMSALTSLSPMLDKMSRSYLGKEFENGIASKRTGEVTGTTHTAVEKFAYGVFGLSNYKLQEYHHSRAGLKNHRAMLKNIAEGMARLANKQLTENGITPESLQKAFNGVGPTLDTISNQEDRDAIAREFRKMLVNSDTGEMTAFTKLISRAVADKDAKTSILRVASMYPNMFTEEQKRDIAQLMDVLQDGNTLKNSVTVNTGENNATN